MYPIGHQLNTNPTMLRIILAENIVSGKPRHKVQNEKSHINNDWGWEDEHIKEYRNRAFALMKNSNFQKIKIEAKTVEEGYLTRIHYSP